MTPAELAGRRGPILKRWLELVLRAYPEGSARFFRDEKDAFRNPVGATVRSSLAVLLDGLLSGEESAEVHDALDRMVRMRAVQDFTPGEAVEFLLRLKQAAVEVAGEEAAGEERAWFRDFDSRVDRLLLRAVDVYVGCRERMHQIRTRDTVARTYSLLRRAGAVEEEDAREPARGRRRPVRLRGGQEG